MLFLFLCEQNTGAAPNHGNAKAFHAGCCVVDLLRKGIEEREKLDELLRMTATKNYLQSAELGVLGAAYHLVK